jgi:hypothetical protein
VYACDIDKRDDGRGSPYAAPLWQTKSASLWNCIKNNNNSIIADFTAQFPVQELTHEGKKRKYEIVVNARLSSFPMEPPLITCPCIACGSTELHPGSICGYWE